MAFDLKKWREMLAIETAADQLARAKTELESFSAAQLERLPTLFVASDDSVAPLAPAIAFRGAKQMAREGLRLANTAEQALRDLAFENRTRGGYDGPRLIADGDSWFQYPFLLKDTVDWLSQTYAIRSFAAGGDRLSQIAARGKLADAVAQDKAQVLLLSGGGNDLLAPEVLETMALTDASLDKQAFDKAAKGLQENLKTIFQEARAANPKVEIYLHAYDYALSRADGHWLGRPLQDQGFEEAQINALVAAMMDRLAETYQDLCENTSAHFVDCRKVVGGPENWHDELHPTSQAFERIAEKFDQQMRAFD